VRRAASRIRSRSAWSMGRSAYLRTFRRARMASHVSTAKDDSASHRSPGKLTRSIGRGQNRRSVGVDLGGPRVIGREGSEGDRSWNRIARNAGYVAGVAFLVGTVLIPARRARPARRV